MRKNSNSYMRNRSRRCSKKALIFFFPILVLMKRLGVAKLYFFFFAFEQYNASAFIETSSYIRRSAQQEPDRHSQMTELVLCFMDKMTGNALFLPKVVSSISWCVKCLSHTELKRASRNVGHQKAKLFSQGLCYLLFFF